MRDVRFGFFHDRTQVVDLGIREACRFDQIVLAQISEYVEQDFLVPGRKIACPVIGNRIRRDLVSGPVFGYAGDFDVGPAESDCRLQRPVARDNAVSVYDERLTLTKLGQRLLDSFEIALIVAPSVSRVLLQR